MERAVVPAGPAGRLRAQRGRRPVAGGAPAWRPRGAAPVPVLRIGGDAVGWVRVGGPRPGDRLARDRGAAILSVRKRKAPKPDSRRRGKVAQDWIGRADIAGPPLSESAERSILTHVRVILAAHCRFRVGCGRIGVSIRDPDVTVIAWSDRCVRQTLGRWMTRLAVTVGAGSCSPRHYRPPWLRQASETVEVSSVKPVSVVRAPQVKPSPSMSPKAATGTRPVRASARAGVIHPAPCPKDWGMGARSEGSGQPLRQSLLADHRPPVPAGRPAVVADPAPPTGRIRRPPLRSTRWPSWRWRRSPRPWSFASTSGGRCP